MRLREYTELKKTLGPQVSSPRQINGLFEADCEIIKISAANFIVTSTDSIAEEISLGLYKKISTWAWLTVMSSVADLAASGATPIGITLSTQWAFGTSKKVQTTFFKEIHNACKAAKVPLLGGDSGYAQDHVFTASILGHSTKKPLTRMGAKAGDYIVIANSKTLGLGPALSYSYLLKSSFNENLFRPLPSWQQAQKIRSIAAAAIDTSDGLTIALYTLAALNNLGFKIQWSEEIIHPKALSFCRRKKISPLLLYLNDLGDLQNIFVIPKKNIHKLPRGFLVLGQFEKEKHYQLEHQEQIIDLPVLDITEVPRTKDAYLRLFSRLERKFQNFARP